MKDVGTQKMDWARLLSTRRLGQENRSNGREDRTEFQRDYDRLIFSAPFRRLQNKTQVFPLPGSIFVHNRLTHSLEVSSVGRSLGNDVSRLLRSRHPELEGTHFSEMGSVVSAACLAHDLGNPPFGHGGEKAIATYFSEGEGQFLRDYICPDTGDGLSETQWQDVIHFEGNANAFRLLTHHFLGRREGGFVMTYSTLASIVKYPVSSNQAGEKGKFGFFESERKHFERIAEELGILRLPCEGDGVRYVRHPLVWLVEAADDICYEIMDIEDAHKLKILTTVETKELLLAFFEGEQRERIERRMDTLEDTNEQVVYLRSCVINCLEMECVRVFVEHEDEILSGCFNGALVQHIADRPRGAFQRCVEVAFQRIYPCKDVVDIEIAGYRVITSLLDLMIRAVISPQKAYSQQLLNRVSPQYDVRAKNLYDRIMAVLDYISGMTDVYALEVYRRIHGIHVPNM